MVCLCAKMSLEIYIIDIRVERTSLFVSIVKIIALKINFHFVTSFSQWCWWQVPTYFTFWISFTHFHTVNWTILTNCISIIHFMDSKSFIFIPLNFLWKQTKSWFVNRCEKFAMSRNSWTYDMHCNLLQLKIHTFHNICTKKLFTGESLRKYSHHCWPYLWPYLWFLPFHCHFAIIILGEITWLESLGKK